MVVMKKNRQLGSYEEEDSTLYGEFISSFDKWISPEKQRKRADYLAEITKEISPTVNNRANKGR